MRRLIDAVAGRLTYANVVATLALFVALGGGAYAAISGIPDRAGVFHGCVDSRSGALRVVRSARSCRKSRTVSVRRRGRRRRVRVAGEFAIAWSQKGPAGKRGTAGAGGAAGSAGARGTDFDANATLPAGQTLSGPWALASSGPGGAAQTTVQFSPRLAAAIPTGQTQFHFASGPFSAQCPGPGQAAAGFFCLYENAALNMAFGGASSTPPTGQRGEGFYYNVSAANASAYGTWATTG